MERHKLDKWLTTLTPGTVVRRIVEVWREGSKVGAGSVYYKVLEVEPVLTARLLHVDTCFRATSLYYHARAREVFELMDEQIANLRPVGGRGYRELVMAIFAE